MSTVLFFHKIAQLVVVDKLLSEDGSHRTDVRDVLSRQRPLRVQRTRKCCGGDRRKMLVSEPWYESYRWVRDRPVIAPKSNP